MANLFVFLGMMICQMLSFLSSMKHIVNSLYDFEDTFKNMDKNLSKLKKKVCNNSEQSQIVNKDNIISILKPIEKIKLETELTKIEKNIEKEGKIFEINKNNKPFKANNLEPLNKISSGACPPKEISDSFILERFSKENEVVSENCITNQNAITEKDAFESPQNINISPENLSKSSLEIGSIEYLKYLIKTLFRLKKSDKEILIQKSIEIYKDELDIANILKKLHEIDNLKMLLLNEDQQVLFNYLTKPIIPLKDIVSSDKLPRRSLFKQPQTKKKFFGKLFKMC